MRQAAAAFAGFDIAKVANFGARDVNRLLKDAGIVTDRRQGRWVYYSLNPETMEAMEGFVKALRATSKLRVLAASCD